MLKRDGLLGAIERRLARRVRRRALRMVNSRPLVSFTFDDVPASACETGRTILEHHGIRGTYFVSGGLSIEARGVGGLFRASHLAELHAAGHEIGSHGYGHQPYQALARDAVDLDMRTNDDYLRDVIGVDFRAVSFSFPFGSTGVRSKEIVASRFAAARGVQAGVNRGEIDTLLLLGTPLYEQLMTTATVDRLLDEAWRHAGWLIFYTHEVEATPSRVGCTSTSFAKVVETVIRRGFQVLPVKDALAIASGEQHSPA